MTIRRGNSMGQRNTLLTGKTLYAVPRAQSIARNKSRASKHRIKSALSWEYAEHISHTSENRTFEENNLMQRVLHRPVELAGLHGTWPSPTTRALSPTTIC